jgi:hypothetical protein
MPSLLIRLILSDSSTKSFATALRLFWDIVCLRRGPEDLPASQALLAMTIFAQAVLGLVIGAILPPVPMAKADDHSIALLLIDILVVLLWGWVILRVAGKSERFLQTLTAVFGCQLVLQPVLAPAAWAVAFYGKDSTWSLPATLIVAVVGLWGLAVLARVLRAATGWATFFCAALVVSQGLLTYLIAFALFPDLAK